MPKLLKRPKVVKDQSGRAVLLREQVKNKWERVVQCGKANPGCGAEIQVQFQDLYKHVDKTPFGEEYSYRTMCPHCHDDVLVAHKDTPWHHTEVPGKVRWLRQYMESLTMQLHEECEPQDRQRLHQALLSDGIATQYLKDLDWS